MFKIITTRKYNHLRNLLDKYVNLVIKQEHLITNLLNKNRALLRENEALRNDVNTLKAMLTGGSNIDFPNSSKGGSKDHSGNVDVNDILQN